MSLNDPMFYLELAGSCVAQASRAASPMAAVGLRKLAQTYLEMAEQVRDDARARTTSGVEASRAAA